jgi:hypothetical protein
MANELTYIVNGSGERLFVQIPVKDWERLMSERKRLLSESKFTRTLKRAIDESEQIRMGKVEAVSINEFLNEL